MSAPCGMPALPSLPWGRADGHPLAYPDAIGRCNAQVMPIIGAHVCAPADFLDMTVRVEVTAHLFDARTEELRHQAVLSSDSAS
jgi:hypothetical protein